MDSTQIIITVISFALTILIVILGIQVFFILKEIRISFQKVNKMLEDFGKVTGTVSASVSEVSGFMQGIRSGMKLITSVVRKGDNHE